MKNEFMKVAQLADIPVGGRLEVEYGGEMVGLFNLGGELFAISDICTHDDGPLLEGRLEGDCIICPRHGARFNIKTGQQTMPAFSPVPLYRVKIEGTEVWIAPA